MRPRAPWDFWFWAALFGVAVALMWGGLRAAGIARLGCRVALGVAGAVYVLGFTAWHLHLNRRAPDAPLYPVLGLANGLTLLRGLALALMLVFFCPSRPEDLIAWVPAVLYTFVALSDWWDGFLARVSGRPSLLGARLDLLLDGWGVLLAAALAVLWGRLPAWYWLVGLARYGYLGWLVWLRRRGRSPEALPPNPQRRVTAGLMMSFLAAALWPVFPPQALAWVGVWFFLPFAAGFLRDAVQAGGWRAPKAPRSVPSWWAAGVRWAGAAVSALLLLPLVPWWGMAAAIPLTVLFLLATGVLPRLMALGGLLAVGFAWGSVSVAGFAVATAMLSFTAFYGGGAACLWAPDDRVFLTTVGAAPRMEGVQQ